MNEYVIAMATAAWLGFLTSISPCPLATNIAAISFVSRRVSKVNVVLSAGILYTLGRTFAYTATAMLLVGGIIAAPELSHALQKQMNLLMGPLLILVAMVLLNLLSLKTVSTAAIGVTIQNKIEKMNIFGAFLLGGFFALSFCPISAVLFFGSLLPLAIKFKSTLLLPSIYGIATAIPVLFRFFASIQC